MEALPSDDDFEPAPVAAPSPARRRARIAVTLVLVAALIVLAGIEGSGVIIRSEPVAPPTPSPSAPAPAAARIAVVDAAGALRSMNADGGSIVSYPAPGVTFQFPTWSPDGSRIAAVATDGLGASAGIDVFAVPAGGSPATGPTVVYRRPDHPAFYAYWAPDGKALAMLTNEPNGIALRLVAADGTAPDTTVRNGAPMYWQWVDPTRMLVHSGGGLPGAFVGEVGLSGAPANPAASSGGPFRTPGLSSIGTYIAYATSGQGDSGAVVVDSRDGATHHEVPIFGGAAFEFSPVGDTLAFTAADKTGTAAELPVGPLRAIDPATRRT